MSTATSYGIARFTHDKPCPVCGGSDYDPRGNGSRCFGFISDGYIHCTREEFSSGCKFHGTSETYWHILKGECRCGVEHNPAEPTNGKAKPAGFGEVDRVYKYHGPDGKILFEVVRFKNPKTFRQRRPVVNGSKPVWSLKGIETVLYHLPLLLAADPDQPVWICEGEKDVEALAALGRLATCNPMGSGKWRDHYADILKGRHCIIVPDNDQAGREHARQVAQSLQGKAASVKVVELPDLPERGDVSDFLARGGTVDQLDELAHKAREWAPAADPGDESPGPSLPEIVIGSVLPSEGLKKWTPLALAALAKLNGSSPVVFQRGGNLSRVIKPDDESPPQIDELSPDSLRGIMDRSATWGTRYETQKRSVVRYGPPPGDIVRDILSLKSYDPREFPVINSVVESPRFLPDGRLVLDPGYSAEGKFFYAPTHDLVGLDVPACPTPRDVEAAKSLLVDDLFVDFTFADDSSRANAIGLTLLPFVRPMIDGPTPNHHFDASTEGTGKGLLAAACAFPALGRELDLHAQKESEAEWRKALTSAFMSGAQYYFLDNLANIAGRDGIPGPIDSGTLAMAWTAPYYRDRILGGNQEVRVKVQTIFMSSGNNVAFSRELVRRQVRIELVAIIENPSLRDGFKHSPLLEWAASNHRELVRACLVLCRHWIAKGKAPGTEVMGSYETYARTMGGILSACGVPGFLANRPKAVTHDREAIQWVAFVNAWHKSNVPAVAPTSKLLEIIKHDKDLMEQFYETVGEVSEASQKAKLGKALLRHNKRIYGDFRIVQSTAKTRDKTSMWRLQGKDTPILEEQVEQEGEDDHVPF